MNYDSEKKSRKLRRLVIYSGATLFFFVLTVAILYGIRPLLLPFILGAFLAYLLKPVARGFRGSTFHKYTRALALVIVLGATFYWGGVFIRSSLPNKHEKLQLKVRLQYQLNERYRSWMGLNKSEKGNFVYQAVGKELDDIKKKISDASKLTEEERTAFLMHYNGNPEPESDKYYNYYLANLKRQKIDIEKLKETQKTNDKNPPDQPVAPAESKSQLAQALQTLTHWIIFPLAFMFILLDRGQILHFFMSLIPNRYFELTFNVLEKVDEALGKYIRGTIIESSLVGLTLIVGFYLCGIDIQASIIIGLIGGIVNAIPFAGTALTCVVGAAYSLIAEDINPILPFITPDNLMLAVISVVMFAHLLDNAIFQPLVVGSAVNVHPLAVIMGVFGGSIMFGFAGLIFAIPSIVVLKVVTQTLFRGLKDYRIV